MPEDPDAVLRRLTDRLAPAGPVSRRDPGNPTTAQPGRGRPLTGRRGPGGGTHGWALDRVGLGLCVVSAAGFGSLAIFGNQAYAWSGSWPLPVQCAL